MFNLLDPKPLFAPTPGCTATSCFQYGEDCGWNSGEFFTSFLFKRRQSWNYVRSNLGLQVIQKVYLLTKSLRQCAIKRLKFTLHNLYLV